MDFVDKIEEIVKRYHESKKLLTTEEATKNSLVLPFLQALGYNVFDPTEVIPEYTADHGVKKGEKVDYAIQQNDKIIIIIECKKLDTVLSNDHASQLYRYFSVTETRFSILTNGYQYMFFTDLDKENTMDFAPFFVFDIREYASHELDELKKFTKSSFDLHEILNTANDLKYTGLVKSVLKRELDTPSDEFVKYFTSQIYTGRVTQSILDQFRKIVKNARQQFVNEQINERLKLALNRQNEDKTKTIDQDQDHDQVEEESDGIITTADEIEGFHIIKSIIRKECDASRVYMRDAKSYCSILLDNNNRKLLCRLHFNGKKYYIGLFKNKQESKVLIEQLDDIYQYADQILATIKEHDAVDMG